MGAAAEMTLRTIFFGSSDSVFSNRHFTALREAACDTVAVVDVPLARRTSTNTQTQGGAPDFVAYARQHGIPAFEPTSPNRPEFVQAMADLRPDLFLAVGYLNLLKAGILGVPRLLAANFHASLLPAYRGKHPLFWALRNNERWTGLTVHAMSGGLDTGDILYQVRVRTRRDDSVASLYDRVIVRSLPLVSRLIADAEAGRLRPRPQDEAGASYYSSVTEADFRLDWSDPAARLRRWICVSPGQCFFEVAGQRVYVVAAELSPTATTAASGTLLDIGRSTCTVATGQGALRLNSVRHSGGHEQTAAAWCRGANLHVDDRLAPA
jgi:methionyl-tRNA formyltransferase